MRFLIPKKVFNLKIISSLLNCPNMFVSHKKFQKVQKTENKKRIYFTPIFHPHLPFFKHTSVFFLENILISFLFPKSPPRLLNESNVYSEKEPVTVRVAGDAYLGYDLAQIGEFSSPLTKSPNILNQLIMVHGHGYNRPRFCEHFN